MKYLNRLMLGNLVSKMTTRSHAERDDLRLDTWLRVHFPEPRERVIARAKRDRINRSATLTNGEDGILPDAREVASVAFE